MKQRLPLAEAPPTSPATAGLRGTREIAAPTPGCLAAAVPAVQWPCALPKRVMHADLFGAKTITETALLHTASCY